MLEDYRQANVSDAIVKIIQSYIPYVNKYIWKSKLRILIVSQYFWPEHFRVNEIVQFFRKKIVMLIY